MKKHILLLVLVFIGFISCEPDGPENFLGTKWGMTKDKVKNILNQNNIDIIDYNDYIQINDTFYGIENCQIEYHFKNNKFYKAKIYKKEGQNDSILDLLTISENFVSDMDTKYGKKHFMTKFNNNTEFVNTKGFTFEWIFKRCYISLFVEDYRIINERVLFVEITYSKDEKHPIPSERLR